MRKIVFFCIGVFLFATTLAQALKEKKYPIDIITETKPVYKKLFKESKIDLNAPEKPIHSLNLGVIKLKKKQRKIEKEVSKDIKKIFLLPKEIKVKANLKQNKIFTNFIYKFEK